MTARSCSENLQNMKKKKLQQVVNNSCCYKEISLGAAIVVSSEVDGIFTVKHDIKMAVKASQWITLFDYTLDWLWREFHLAWCSVANVVQ